MKIYNDFGITPTRNHTAAGYDFYVPNIDDTNKEQVNRFQLALAKSYNVADPTPMLQAIYAWVRKVKNLSLDTPINNLNNILHLYLAVNHNNRLPVINDFCDRYITFDNAGHVGVRLFSGDTLFINSGIKEAINHGYAGVFLNKSGRGTKGFDVRAQVVDEDYTGHVHLSLQYLGKDREQGVVYCGDKIVQQLVIPVLSEAVEELTSNEYNKVMSGSARGDSGFGSSDEKHTDKATPVTQATPVTPAATTQEQVKPTEEVKPVEEIKTKTTKNTQKKTKQS